MVVVVKEEEEETKKSSRWMRKSAFNAVGKDGNLWKFAK